MDEVVPGVLQRLRAADIIRMAGLAVASLGQEYSRVGAVRDGLRRGAQLSGIVDLSQVHGAADIAGYDERAALRCSVDVELLDANHWIVACSCTPGSSAVCAHAAALLYEWLAHPSTFGSPETPPLYPRAVDADVSLPSQPSGLFPPAGIRRSLAGSQGPEPLGELVDILGQMGLSELRTLAREYDIATERLTKQHLIEAISGALSEPATIRKTAGALEKPLGQLLATIILAGGTVTDEDLHGLFERFGFAQSSKLQNALMALQSKALLLRTSINSSSQQRIGLSGSLIDIGWHVPMEVRTALRVPLPVTPFDIHAAREDALEIRRAEPDALLADLLLIARALVGTRLEESKEQESRRSPDGRDKFPPDGRGTWEGRDKSAPTRSEMTIVPAPAGYPTEAMLDSLEQVLPRSRIFLRYAIRLLRLADILYKDEGDTAGLCILPNAARLLLGPARSEIARDLFTLWLTQSGYDELFGLQEEQLRLCCRTTLTNYPLLRGGELEEENREARQILLTYIAQAPINRWIQFPAFARFIYRLNPLFLQKRQRLFPTPHWWIEQDLHSDRLNESGGDSDRDGFSIDRRNPEGRPLQPTQMSDWIRAEGRYLERLLRGPLHWWGMVDLALARDGRLLAFSLTPLADQFLNGHVPAAQETSAPAERDQLRGHTESEHDEAGRDKSAPTVGVQGEVLVPARTEAWPIIERIEAFSEVAGVRDGRLRYRLTPSALAEALGRGQDASSLLALLRESAAAQPGMTRDLEQLLEQITEWNASYGRVRLYTGVSLLQIADASVMRELLMTTSVEQHIVQSITPTLMILKKQGAERLTEEIKRRGQSPLLHEEEYDGAE